MFFFPFSDNISLSRLPLVNYLLIGLNVLVFCLVNLGENAQEMLLSHAFYPDHPGVLSALTSMFLHAGLGHLIGNMLFLHIYGDNVEDQMGHVGYLAFYLVAGGIASFFHAATATVPAIGASGAIAGVMGAYVVFFPRAKVRFFFLCILPPIRKTFELYSWFALGGWFAAQLMSHFGGDEAGIAFAAHIGGFICGGVIGGLLLLANLVEPHGAKKAFPLKSDPVKAPPVDIGELYRREKERGLPCPCCVKAMPTTRFGSLELDNCFECGGMWLDKGETEALLATPDLPYSLLNPPARSPQSAIVPMGERLCCRCAGRLQKIAIEGVEVEGCDKCGGLWLERGGLGKLKSRL